MFQWGDQKIPILFPDILSHNMVVDALQRRMPLCSAHVVSAGFVTGLQVTGVSGASSSLEIESNEEDVITISRLG